MRIPLLLCLMLGPAVTALSAQDAPQQILERAIQAHAGSTQRLRSLAAIEQTQRGTLNSARGPMPLVMVIRQDQIERFRVDSTLSSGRMKTELTLTLNGDKAWQMTNQQSRELNAAQTAGLRVEAKARAVTTLLPLLEKGWQMTSLPPRKIGNTSVVGFRATHANYPELDLYFDAKRHYLVQLLFEGEEAGLKLKKEWTFREFKSFQGIQLPTRQQVRYDGRPIANMEIVRYDFSTRLDPKIFQQP